MSRTAHTDALVEQAALAGAVAREARETIAVEFSVARDGGTPDFAQVRLALLAAAAPPAELQLHAERSYPTLSELLAAAADVAVAVGRWDLVRVAAVSGGYPRYAFRL